MIITHAHGDHFGALGSFADLPLYAETQVAPALAADMQFTGLYPNAVNAVSGPTLIGDLSYDFGVVSQAETGENGYIAVPAVDALFAGDLVYSDTHLYIREYTPLEAPDELDNWIAGLEALRAGLRRLRLRVRRTRRLQRRRHPPRSTRTSSTSRSRAT